MAFVSSTALNDRILEDVAFFRGASLPPLDVDVKQHGDSSKWDVHGISKIPDITASVSSSAV